MNITHFGHATCLLDFDGTRILVDPGTLGAGWDGLAALDAVLITHGHPDHFDLHRLVTLLAGQPATAVYGDADSIAHLQRGTVVAGGERLDLGGVRVDVASAGHAPVYADVPHLSHAAYGFAGHAVFHPGDSFHVPAGPVDVLLLPVSGPWIKISDAIDYLHAVGPRVAIPIHEGANVQNVTTFEMIERFAPEGTRFLPLERGVATSIDANAVAR